MQQEATAEKHRRENSPSTEAKAAMHRYILRHAIKAINEGSEKAIQIILASATDYEASEHHATITAKQIQASAKRDTEMIEALIESTL